MEVLVTGATGFIGRHVAIALTTRGDTVRALARPTSDAWKRELLERHGVRIVEGDVTTGDGLDAALDGVDAVVHAAAFVRFGKVDRDRMLRTNVTGTTNVLDACRRHDVARVLHVSSIAALGTLDHGEADEATEHSGRYGSPYEESKHRSALAATEAAEAGLHVVQALPSVVFGRGDPNFGVFFRRWARGKIPILPGPETVLSFIHVEDLARGLLLALDTGARGDRYVFTQANITLRDLFAVLEDASGIRSPAIVVPTALARTVTRGAAYALRPTPWRGRVRPESADILGRTRTYANRRAVEDLGWDPGDLTARLADTARYYAGKYGPPEARERWAHVLDAPTLVTHGRFSDAASKPVAPRATTPKEAAR